MSARGENKGKDVIEFGELLKPVPEPPWSLENPLVLEVRLRMRRK